MDFNIDDIINDIKEKSYWDECEKSYNECLIKYKIPNNTLNNYDECCNLINDFMTDIFVKEIKEDFDADSRHVFGNVGRDHLRRYFGENLLQTVYDQMLTGTNGGVYGVLKKLVQIMTEDTSTLVIKSKIGDYIRDLDLKDKIILSEEYIDKYSKYLPNMLKDTPVLVAIKLDEVILEHIKIEIKIRDSIA